MILRLTQKLAKKVKEEPLKAHSLDANPMADWSAQLFTADRAQYVLLTNTASLYSALMYGRGVVDGNALVVRGLEAIRETMIDDGQEFMYRRFVAPSSGTVCFSKALSRSVTSSMNDLVKHATYWLVASQMTPSETTSELNDIPFSNLNRRSPRKALKSLMVEPRDAPQ